MGPAGLERLEIGEKQLWKYEETTKTTRSHYSTITYSQGGDGIFGGNAPADIVIQGESTGIEPIEIPSSSEESDSEVRNSSASTLLLEYILFTKDNSLI